MEPEFHNAGEYPWMKPVLEGIILPHARAWAFLTAYGELLIGLGLVVGVLTRVARYSVSRLCRFFGFLPGILNHTLPYGDTSVHPSTGLSSLPVSLLSSSASQKLDGLPGLVF